MAKKEMICPFLGQRCKNCAIYIGRHYYLCYSRNYRGYRGPRRATKKAATRHPFTGSTRKTFQIPKMEATSLDPFETDL